MLDLILWLLVTLAIGLAAVPVLYIAFPSLTDRAFGLARPLGLVLIGAVVWMVSLLGILPSTSWSWWLVTLAVAAVGWQYIWRFRRDQFWGFLKKRWRHILITEVLFLVFFSLFAFYRLHDPDISSTEKPMDLTMLNAVVSASNAPPGDLWLSGHPISYYYFGYWMFGGIVEMSGVATEVAFNLTLALIAGMAAAGIYSLTTNLVRRDGGSTSYAVTAGIAAAVFLLVISNLNGMWELLSQSRIGSDGFYEWLAIKGVDLDDPSQGEDWRPTGFWWWWASSRIINSFHTADGETIADLDFTIQEFPFFSLILGDLHPHVMSIPFILLSVSMIVNILFSPVRWGFSWLFRHRTAALLLVIMTGASGFINAWDLVIMLTILFGVVYLKSYSENGRSHLKAMQATIPPLVSILVLAAVFYSNYYFVTLRSQVQFPPVVPVRYGTRPIHFFTVWGGLVSFAVVFLVSYTLPTVWTGWSRARERIGFKPRSFLGYDFTPWIISVSVVFFLFLLWFASHYGSGRFTDQLDVYRRLGVGGGLGIVFIVLFVTTYTRGAKGADDGAQVALTASSYVALLLFGAEMFFVHDFFGTRMNTIFKFYYHSWILLSLVGGYGVFHLLRHLPTLVGYKRVLTTAALMIAVVFFTASLYYPVAASISKSLESGTRATLDGLAFLENRDQGVRDALIWIRDNMTPEDTLIEGVGGSYSEFGRFSGFTGVPSLLGWSGHENQWRGGDELWAQRERDIDRIYNGPPEEESLDPSEDALRIASMYDADYIVVSPLERRKYTELDESKFDRISQRVYQNEQVTIYALEQ